MSEINAKDLLKKYAEGNCSPEERALVETYYNQFQASSGKELPEQELAENLQHIWAKLSPAKSLRPFKLWYAISAAVILMVCSVGLYFYIQGNDSKSVVNQASIATADVIPGAKRAMLTLADGSKISLVDAGKGDIARQAGIRIIKTNDGNLTYAGSDTHTDNMFNTIQTPKGGEFQINLPDGTKVWLNAESSLKYPVAFNGNERKVILTGEAYFEVTPNKKMPFKVLTNKQEVEVLGTHFNVNAYEDNRRTKTTLVEGSVKVKEFIHANVRLLKPGQLAVLEENSLYIKEADIESEIAWKNGYFIFNDEELESIMLKISRWYDINVVYTNGLSNKDVKFGGIVSRSKNISVVLNTMERTGKVHFKLQGKQVTVLP